MSFYIEQKYVSMLGVKLEGFVRKSNGVYNCRCPLCGDSRKSKSKKRGYIYEKKGKFFFRCHNCGRSITFRNLLKIIDPYLYQEYQVECYRDNNVDKVLEPDWHEFISKPTFPTHAKINLPTIASLPDDHTAKKYAVGRKIPKAWLERLYYANDFKAFVDEVFPGRSTALKGEDVRIVIPFFDRENELIGIQGRALSSTAKSKYITVKRTEDAPKIFGLDRLDFTKPIFVVEGPLDSMFLSNAVATMDSSLCSVIGTVGDHDYVFVHDCEPRNREIVKQMQRSIDTGKRICIWPKELQHKDINDMVIGGIDVVAMIEQHTYQGLKAQLEFNLWRKT